MNCLDEDAILGLLDGHLDTAQLYEVEAHIDACDECRRLVSTLAAEKVEADDPLRSPSESLVTGPGSLLDGRFVLEAVAGSGGMGRVYRARDLRSGTTVAVKRVDIEDERFIREARVLADLAHSAIVRHVADGVGEDGTRYLAMEWLDGEDLAQRLARGPLSVEATLILGARVASALGAAHAQGIVHRDVKPSNIFLPDGDVEQAKVVDFGMARAPAASSIRTRTGVLLGTPGYMAPEQARGDTSIGPTADVFSLGCVLYECLTGERANAGSNIIAVIANLLTAKPPHARARAPHVPRALDALVTRMLARAPSQRPADGAAVQAELTALGSTGTRGRPLTLRQVAGFIAVGALLVGSGAALRSRFTPSLQGTPVVAGPNVDAPSAVTDFAAAAATGAEAAAEYGAGLTAIREAALSRAKEHLLRAVELDPSLAAAHLRLSIWTDTVMDAAEVRTHYQAARTHASKLSPRDQELFHAIEPGYALEPPDMNEVQRRLRALAIRRPKDAELLLLAVGVSGADTKAGDYEEILRIDPKFAYAWWAQANAQFRINDTAGARASVERCIEAAPNATLCILMRTRIDAREGRCAEMERDARLVVALENGAPYGYAQLANALAAQDTDRAAIEAAVHARALATTQPRARTKVELLDRAQIAAAFGDFVEAERQARLLDDLVKDDAFREEHVQAAILLVDVLEERGDDVGAGQVADAFLRRRAAWRSAAYRASDDPRPTFLAAALRVGLRSNAEVERERAAWRAEWEAKLGDAGAEELWVEGWARPALHAQDWGPAAATMPEASKHKTLLPGAPGWISPQGLWIAHAGRAQLAGDRPHEAVASLSFIARHCAVLSDAISRGRASFWLGLAYEAIADSPRACESYDALLRRWGRARPRSVTADAARARARALHCELTTAAP